MCGGKLGGGRHRLREALEPAQPVQVSGVFLSPEETGMAVADWVVSGYKSQWAQNRVYSEDLKGSPQACGGLSSI